MYPRLGLAVLFAALAAAIPASASAATNLGAYWHLDESAGALATDSSGNANHGTVNGPARVAGRFSRSLRFDGVDDSVNFARSATLEPATVTVEGWVRGTNPGNFKHIVSQGAYLCEVASYGLYTGNGGVAFYVSNGSDDQLAVSPQAPATVWDGAWHHVAGTYDGARVRLFVDGAEVGTGTPATIPIGYGLPNPAGQLGAFGGGPCVLNWAGDLDEPRIWRRALSAQEIAASFAMGGPGAVRLSQRVDATQALTFNAEFSTGNNIKISTESSTGTEQITSIKLVGLLPLTATATCRGGLLALLNSSCDYTLSNGGRTATLTVRPILLQPVATLRVTVSSGRTFDVDVDTSGRNATATISAEVKVSAGT
jgi:hypothetical protein